MAGIDVSVIIVSWNTRDILRDCLESVYAQTKDVAFEVIVVDNASADGSSQMVKRDFPQVHLIENADNRGFAAGNNQGMRLAAGRYVLLLNSDTIVLDNAIAKTVAFADATPRTAVIGCQVLNQDHTLQPTCFMFPSLLNMLLSVSYLYKLFPRNRLFGRERMTWWDRDDVREVDVVTGCFMLVRREAIEQVGVMDEKFFMYGEETDWCYRFWRAGWRVVFAPVAQIIHLGGQSSKKVRGEMLVALRLSLLQFMGKHHGGLNYRIACLLTASFLFLRLPVWAARWLVGGEGGAAAKVRFQAYLRGVRKSLGALFRSPAGIRSMYGS